MKNNVLDIGDVVRVSGLPASTLRFYEEKGLIQSVGRSGLRRVFSADVVQRLALITLGRKAGFSLAEIETMLLDTVTINRDQLVAKADELDRTIRHLMAIRDTLRHIADCPAPDHFDCPTFQRLIDVAVKHQRHQQKRKNRPKNPEG